MTNAAETLNATSDEHRPERLLGTAASGATARNDPIKGSPRVTRGPSKRSSNSPST
jgi:hypothetical protein